MYDNGIEDLLNRIDIIGNAYDLIRIVDPLSKKVVAYKDKMLSETNTCCFDFWGKSEACSNCISKRAHNENISLVKLECTDSATFLLTAIPFELNGRRVILELLKNINNSMSFVLDQHADDSHKEISGMHELIDHLTDLSFKDALTGVYNRRYVDEKLSVDLINAALSKSDIAVIIADIDHFKQVNDTYGHIAGDCVLKEFAQTIQGCFKRESDWVARYGGEEFLICLPGANTKFAVSFSEKIRTLTSEKTILWESHPISVTASFGVYATIPGKEDTVEKFIRIIDDKLYQAKKSGRNKVTY